MTKYHAICPADDINIPFDFTLKGEEGKERVDELNPPALREMLTGQALLAYQKLRLQIEGNLEGMGLIQSRAYITKVERE